jgi:hypothetical protein
MNAFALWLSVQLRKGILPDGKRLWSEQQATEMWTPQTLIYATPGATKENPTRPVLRSYALGWIVDDLRGRREIRHGGSTTGQITYTSLLPDQQIGLAVFSNVEDAAAVAGLNSALLDYLLGVSEVDWLSVTRQKIQSEQAPLMATTAQGDFIRPKGGPSLSLKQYAGNYRDPWYGDIVIIEKSGKLTIDFTRTPVFKGPLETWGTDTFRTRWAKGAGEDAVVTFTIADGVVTGMKLKALSPLADFSYDFHDLDPKRVQ